MMRKLIIGLVALFASFGPIHAATLDVSAADDTPAFNSAVASLCSASSSDRTLNIPAGDVTFNSAPNAIACALNLVGQGKGGTRLLRNYNNGSFIWFTRGLDHSGGSIRDMNIEAAPGTTGGIAIWVQALADTDPTQNSYNRHSFIIQNVQVGRTSLVGSWDFGLYLDGASNPDGNANSVPGIRGTYVYESSFGGTNTANVYINKGRGVWFAGECYTPLNGSAAAIVADNITQSVWMESRNCTLKSWDHTASDLRQAATTTVTP